jgi:ABC-type lipoprotein release transport system permease subunit
MLENKDGQFAIAGAGVAWYLGLNPRNPAALLTVYVPQRGNPSSFSIDQAFEFRTVNVAGIFNSKQEIDETQVLVPLEFASELLHYQNEITSIEVFAAPNTNNARLKKEIESIVGQDFTVKNRIQQQETLFQIMHSEKWAIFIILAFILVLATFNVIGSLTMLIVDKRKDINILRNIGAAPLLIRRLFLTEGVLISMSGGLLGLFIGILVIVVQQYFGILKLGSEAGTFVIDAYPVQLQLMDVVSVFVLVVAIGWLSSVYTVRQVVKRIEIE